MKDWLKRHAVLTREEFWLVTGILFILLVGAVARYGFMNRGGGAEPSAEQPAKQRISHD